MAGRGPESKGSTLAPLLLRLDPPNGGTVRLESASERVEVFWAPRTPSDMLDLRIVTPGHAEGVVLNVAPCAKEGGSVVFLDLLQPDDVPKEPQRGIEVRRGEGNVPELC
jgi:hypothetical protein